MSPKPLSQQKTRLHGVNIIHEKVEISRTKTYIFDLLEEVETLKQKKWKRNIVQENSSR